MLKFTERKILTSTSNKIMIQYYKPHTKYIKLKRFFNYGPY